MKRIMGAVAAACLAGALLTGCGGGDDNGSGPNDSTDTRTSTSTDASTPPTSPSTPTSDDNGDDNGASGDYCSDLKQAKVTVEALGDDTITQESFDKLAGVMHVIAAEAPDSVSDDWNTLGDAITSISQALQASGLNLDDLSKIGQPGVPTPDPATLQKLTTALQSINEQGITQASTAINAEVLADCGFKLGMGG
jgi:hypothetical protein